ncbi:unnamed protein product [Durusdinium trenchii]|uniref:RING-type domain-containing protein n=1 Tax=Durusdinium trenchii TaxID=1381693 RepID=A0ABP0LSY1_9DINO
MFWAPLSSNRHPFVTAGKHFFTHTACFRGKVPDESVTEPEQGVVVEGACIRQDDFASDYASSWASLSSMSDAADSGGEVLPGDLMVRGAGYGPVNGRYSHAGAFEGKRKYKQIDGKAIILFKLGSWRLNDGDNTGGWCYQAEIDSPTPLSKWVTASPNYGSPPTLSKEPCTDVQESETGDAHDDLTGSPAASSPGEVPDETVELPECIVVEGLDAERFVPRRARHGAALPPFLVARGAERGKINGRYAAESGYKQVEGEAIIFFKWGKWRWNALDRRDGWFYEAPPCEGSDGNLPPFEHWVTRPSLVGVAPSLSLGNYRDIKEGDVVTLAECPDFDWTGCPEGPAKRLSFSGTSWTVTVHELRGEWFYPREFPEKIAPLAGLGAVSLMGKEHCVSGGVLQEVYVACDRSGLSGFYGHHGMHNGKAMYQKLDQTAMIYFSEEWKIGATMDQWTFRHPGLPVSQLPLGRWASSSTSATDPPSLAAVPQLLRVAGTAEQLQGHYARAEHLKGRPIFRQIGGRGVVVSVGRGWKIKHEERASGCYYEHGDLSGRSPPAGQWSSLIGGKAAEVEHVALIPATDTAPRFIWVRGASDEAKVVNGCYVCMGSSNGKPKYMQIGASGIIYFAGNWKIHSENSEDSWFYKHPDPILPIPPTFGWTTEGYTLGQPEVPFLQPQPRYLEQEPEPGQPLPFFEVRGAGLPSVNGRFSKSTRPAVSDRPVYQCAGSTSSAVMYFKKGKWNLHRNNRFDGCQFDYEGPSSGPEHGSPLPPTQWFPRDGPGPAPSLWLGTRRDLREGDVVDFREVSSKVNWFGCPEENGLMRLHFHVGTKATIRRVAGDWFYAENPSKVAPLAAVRHLYLKDTPHCFHEPPQIADASSRDATVEAEQVEGGYDEEWRAEQDVERFRCPICMLVARDAMAHGCGSVLFCELCWLKCIAEDSKCPVCREHGSSIAPAHVERRSIKNLLVKCSNKCGASFHLVEKAEHRKECPKRQVTCAACQTFYDADREEEHQEECEAKWKKCQLCGDQVALEELEAHYASHHFAELVQLVELREEVAQLREEVRHLRGDARMRGGDRPRASAPNHGYDDCFEIDSDRGGALFRLPEFSASDPERASSVPEFSATDSDF